MPLVVREDNSVVLPDELAQELGVHTGNEIEWERTDAGILLKPRHATSRQEAINRLLGSLKDTVKPGESGMEEFLKWRQEERELDFGYQNS